MRYLWALLFLGVILCSALVSAQNYDLKFPAGGGVKSYANLTTSSPSGEKFVFESTELVFPEGGGFFSDAMMKGTGQLLYQKGNDTLLLTANKVISIARDKIILKLNNKNWEFQVNEKTIFGDLMRTFKNIVLRKNFQANEPTIFCDGKQKTDWNKIKPGDMVIVVSRTRNMHTALSVRKGPLLVKTGGPITAPHNASTPVEFACEGGEIGK